MQAEIAGIQECVAGRQVRVIDVEAIEAEIAGVYISIDQVPVVVVAIDPDVPDLDVDADEPGAPASPRSPPPVPAP